MIAMSPPETSQEKQRTIPFVIDDESDRSGVLVETSSLARSYQLPIKRLSEADPSNVQQIAASQIELLSSYHQEVLDQAKRSFFWALVAAGVGFFFFLGTLLFVIYPKEDRKPEFIVVSTIGGVLIEVISAINFYLYGKASSQMADFQERLERTQRFLLANSICEGLEGDVKQNSRSDLIKAIANITVAQETGQANKKSQTNDGDCEK